MMAISTTLVFAVVLAYCGRVPPPTLGAPAADVLAVAGEATAPTGFDTAPTSSVIDGPMVDPPVVETPVDTAAEETVDPPVGGPSQAAQVGVAPPAAARPTSQPSRPSVASNGSGSPAAPAANDSGSAPDDVSVPASSIAPATSTATASAAGPTPPGATAAAAVPTSSTSTTAPATTSTTAKPATTVRATTTTVPATTTTVPATTTTGPATTTTGPATTTTGPATTTTPGPPADRAVAVAVDFQRGSDAASVGLVAMSPGPHGATTDLMISGGVARAQELGVEVYARTSDLGSPDHWVEADLTIGADVTGNFTGVMTRVAESSTGYSWHKFETWGTWNSLRLLTLVDSRIDEEQYFPYQLRANTTYRLRLEARQSTLIGFVDGVELFRVTRTAGAGNRSAGINMTSSGNASNTTLDNLAAGAF